MAAENTPDTHKHAAPNHQHTRSSCFKAILMKMLHPTILAALCLLLQSSPVFAGILVSMQNTTITGSGFIDVMIESTATPGSPDLLDSFSTKLVITPVGGAVAGGLQFSAVQSDAQQALPGYVFFGNSLTSPPLGNVTSGSATGDTYTFGDATNTGTGVSLNSSQPPYLLGRIDLSVVGGLAGSQYTIALANDAFTDFLDPTFTQLSIDPASFSTATVTIGTLSAAVPEPGTWVLMLFLCSLMLGLRLRRRMLAKAQL